MSLIDSLEAMLSRGQDSALLRFGLGSEYLKQDEYDRAALHLRSALEFDVQYSAAWKLLGQALAGAGKRDEAVKAYQDGIKHAEEKGHLHAAKEMRVFLRRLTK